MTRRKTVHGPIVHKVLPRQGASETRCLSGSTGTGDKAGLNSSVDRFLNSEGTVNSVHFVREDDFLLCLGWQDVQSQQISHF